MSHIQIYFEGQYLQTVQTALGPLGLIQQQRRDEFSKLSNILLGSLPAQCSCAITFGTIAQAFHHSILFISLEMEKT